MKRAWAVAFGLLAVLFLSTCGGGGGGGDTLSYTGLSTPAVIDDTNAEAIALAAWYGGEMTDTSHLPGVLSARGAGATAGSRPVSLLSLVGTFRTLANRVGLQGLASPAGRPSPMTVYRDSWREDGVSGYVDISAAWDDQTGGIWGSFSFSGYDDGSGIVLNGQVGFSGTTSIYYTPQPMPGDLLDLALSFSFFTSTDGIETVRIRGTMGLINDVYDAFPFDSSATLDLVVRDEVTEKTIWIKDYTVTVTEGTDLIGLYEDLEISGRIYLHDYGYVDILTFAPFRVYDGDLNPSAGDMIVSGIPLGIDHSQAWLHVVDNVNYEVHFDADGDDSFEGLIVGVW